MVARRLILSTILLASFGTACTALVLGKIGETGDYKTAPSTSSSSGSSGEVDECSLLQGRNSYDNVRDANACSTCIQTECADSVEYACNREGSEPKKDWFSTLSGCAQSPWNGYSPPGAGASFYACKAYEKELAVITGEDDQAKKRASEICVHDKCMQGDLPSCRLCEVSTNKTGTDDKALLRDDPCGQCLVEGCPEVIVACCGEEPMRDFVESCANTADPDRKAQCKELAASVPDSGEKNRNYSDAGDECLTKLSACYKTSCAGKEACK